MRAPNAVAAAGNAAAEDSGGMRARRARRARPRHDARPIAAAAAAAAVPVAAAAGGCGGSDIRPHVEKHLAALGRSTPRDMMGGVLVC